MFFCSLTLLRDLKRYTVYIHKFWHSKPWCRARAIFQKMSTKKKHTVTAKKNPYYGWTHVQVFRSIKCIKLVAHCWTHVLHKHIQSARGDCFNASAEKLVLLLVLIWVWNPPVVRTSWPIWWLQSPGHFDCCTRTIIARCSDLRIPQIRDQCFRRFSWASSQLSCKCLSVCLIWNSWWKWLQNHMRVWSVACLTEFSSCHSSQHTAVLDFLIDVPAPRP